MSMIRVENLTFAYPSSYDNILKMSIFKLIQIGNLGSLVEMAEVKQLF